MLRVSQIQAIAELPVPILTVYLNTQNLNASRHAQVPGDLRWFRKEAASLSRTLLPRDAALFQQEVARVEQFLEGRHPEEKAVSIFAGRQIWTALPLQTSVNSEIRWGKPAVGQLFRLLGEHAPYGIVVVDHRGARLFQFLLGELTELGRKRFDIDESQWKRKDLGHVSSERIRKAHGPDRDLFEHRLEAQYGRLCRETADQAISLSKKHNFAGIFLLGPERLIGTIRMNFTPATEARIVSVPENIGGFSSAEIRRWLEPRIVEYERKQRKTEVEQLLAKDGKSITDPDETFARLRNGTIRAVVVAVDHDFHLHECTKCGTVNRSMIPSAPPAAESAEPSDCLTRFLAWPLNTALGWNL